MKFLALGLTAATLAVSTPASAAIYNLSATTGNVFSDVSFVAGQQYLLEWVGTADGGLYDSANLSCAAAACTSGWNNGIIAVTPPPPNGGTFDANIYSMFGSSGPASFGSAAQALAAYKAGNNIINIELQFQNGVQVGTAQNNGAILNPWRVTAQRSFTTRVRVFDPDQNRANNFGGVSFRITAVPEPATWAMMIVGFGAAGVTLRRRRVAT